MTTTKAFLKPKRRGNHVCSMIFDYFPLALLFPDVLYFHVFPIVFVFASICSSQREMNTNKKTCLPNHAEWLGARPHRQGTQPPKPQSACGHQESPYHLQPRTLTRNQGAKNPGAALPSNFLARGGGRSPGCLRTNLMWPRAGSRAPKTSRNFAPGQARFKKSLGGGLSLILSWAVLLYSWVG